MASGSPGSKRSKKVATSTATKGVSVSRDQDLAELLRWAGEEIGVKAPKLKGGFVEGLRGAFVMSLVGFPFVDWLIRTRWRLEYTTGTTHRQ